MSLLLLFLPSGGGAQTLEFRHGNIPLISGNVYRLTFKARSTLAQSFTVKIQNTAESVLHLNQTGDLEANEWKIFSYEFTALATDDLAKLSIYPYIAIQSFYADNFKLINLTKERKQYRIMRIVGSLLPGSFIQTLTLREKTASETA